MLRQPRMHQNCQSLFQFPMCTVGEAAGQVRHLGFCVPFAASENGVTQAERTLAGFSKAGLLIGQST